MKAFLQRFGALVAGVLQGFDRLVFKGKLRHLYGPEGMHAFFGINRIPREDFKTHVAGITKQILEASLVAEAKKLQRYRYLNSSNTDKEETARQIAAEQRVQTWFPFEIQVGLNGREWLSRQMDAEKLLYLRSDNKFLDVADWQRAQQPSLSNGRQSSLGPMRGRA